MESQDNSKDFCNPALQVVRRRTLVMGAQLVGVLWWLVELVQINIYTEKALLLQHLAMLRIGHLEVVSHIFAYLS